MRTRTKSIFPKVGFLFFAFALTLAPMAAVHAQVAQPQLTISSPAGSAPVTSGTFSALSSYQLQIVGSAEKNQNVELYAYTSPSITGWYGAPEGQTDTNGNWLLSGAAGSWAYGGGGNWTQNWQEYVQFPDGTKSNTVSFTVVSTSSLSCELTASPASMTAGGTATLTWYAQGYPTSCTGSLGGSTGWSGKSLNPTSYGASWTTPALGVTTQFGMSCSGGGATVTCGGSPATVTVTGATPPPAAVPIITGIQGQTGSTYTNGTVTPGESMDIYGTFGASGNTVTVNGTDVTSYITYQGTSQINISLPAAASWLPAGSTNNAITVTVSGVTSALATFSVAAASSGATPPPTAPSCTTFTANPASIASNGSSSLSWNCSNVGSCSIDNGVGTVAAPSGSKSVTPSQTTNYTLACTGAGGGVTATQTVTVKSPPAAVPIIMGVQGENPMLGTYTNGIVTPGDYMVIYGNFGTNYNQVEVNDTNVTSYITYQGLSGAPTTAAPDQVNLSLPVSAPWLTVGQNNMVYVTTYGGVSTEPVTFTVAASGVTSQTSAAGTNPPSPTATTATAAITGVQGYNPNAAGNAAYTANSVVQGAYLTLYGTFGSSGNIVLFDGTTQLPTSSFLYQGTAQINLTLPLLTTGTHTVAVQTASLGATSAASFTVTAANNGGGGGAISGPPSGGYLCPTGYVQNGNICVITPSGGVNNPSSCAQNPGAVGCSTPLPTSNGICSQNNATGAVTCTCNSGYTQILAGCVAVSPTLDCAQTPSDPQCTPEACFSNTSVTGCASIIGTYCAGNHIDDDCVNYCSQHPGAVGCPSTSASETCASGAMRFCDSASNSCGQIASVEQFCGTDGTWPACTLDTISPPSEDGCPPSVSGSCTAGSPPASCTSIANSCGMTAPGTQVCNSDGTLGTCTAVTPSEDQCPSDEFCQDPANAGDSNCAPMCASNPDLCVTSQDENSEQPTGGEDVTNYTCGDMVGAYPDCYMPIGQN